MTTDLPIYEDALGQQHRNPWVDVVFFQGEQHDDPELMALLDADFLDAQAAADYLANWDYGRETDEAHTTDQDPRTIDRWGLVINVELAEGHEYVLTVNRQLGLYGLYRRPLDWEGLGFQHEGYASNLTGAWFCITCDSPLCELA